MKKNILFGFFILLMFSCTTENNNTSLETTTTHPSISENISTDSSKNAPPKKSTEPALKLSMRTEMKAVLKEMKAKLVSQIETGLDKKLVENYMEESKSYMSFYGDSLAAEHLFLAADFARGVGNFKEALDAWQVIYKAYARDNHPKVPHSIFAVAFTYENLLDRKDLAEVMYKQLVKKHPNHPLTQEAKVILKNMNKSPEELIKEFQKKSN